MIMLSDYHFTSNLIEIIPDIKCQNLSEKQQKKKEGELILAKVAATDQLILLDENGKNFSSVGFGVAKELCQNTCCN
jgi:23S rRNA pseudoU1915 N3-methylase RlmH